MTFGIILIAIAMAMFALVWYTSDSDKVRLVVAKALGHRSSSDHHLDESDITDRLVALQGLLLVLVPILGLTGIVALGLGLAML